jgi:hypothetical protein
VSHIHTLLFSLPNLTPPKPSKQSVASGQSIPRSSWQEQTLKGSFPPYRLSSNSTSLRPHWPLLRPAVYFPVTFPSSPPSTTTTLLSEAVFRAGVLAHISSRHPPWYVAATCQQSVHRLTEHQQEAPPLPSWRTTTNRRIIATRTVCNSTLASRTIRRPSPPSKLVPSLPRPPHSRNQTNMPLVSKKFGEHRRRSSLA